VRGADVLLVTGPGHGAPANLANLTLEVRVGTDQSLIGPWIDSRPEATIHDMCCCISYEIDGPSLRD
jgi:hypothetical protein